MKMLLTAVALGALVASPALPQTPRRHGSHHAHTQYQAARYYDYDAQYSGGDTAASLDE